MIYWIKEKANKVYAAFNQDWMNHGCSEYECMQTDLAQTLFLGTQLQAKHFIKTWQAAVCELHYLPQNTDAARLYTLLGERSPFIKAGGVLNEDSIHIHFAFINELKELCGFMLVYKKDCPSLWVLGVVTNTHLHPKDRWIYLVSSLNLNEHQPIPQRVHVASENGFKHPISHEEFPLIHQLLEKIIEKNSQTIHSKAPRIIHLLRTIRLKASSQEAICDPFMNLMSHFDLLFAPNGVLDVIQKYEIRLSKAMLVECMSVHSPLKSEIRKRLLVQDESINKNVLHLIITCYEGDVLLKQRTFLTQEVFQPMLRGVIIHEHGISLIPQLIQNKCPTTLFRQIIFDEVYSCSVKTLIELGYYEDVLLKLSHANKQYQLKQLAQITDESLRQLGFIFWVKKELNEFNEIFQACQKYPLLAETLVNLVKENRIHIASLHALALSPLRHQRKSIIHHFAVVCAHPAFEYSDLKKLDEEELNALTQTLLTLKKTGVKTLGLYLLAMQKNKQGQLMRLFLPVLGAIDSIKQRAALFNVFMIGLKKGVVHQALAIRPIKDRRLKAQAHTLSEQFLCVNQLLKLNLNQQVIKLAMDANHDRGIRFRIILLKVESMCRLIHEKIRGGAYNKQQIKEWQNLDIRYRRAIYRIVHEGLTKPAMCVHARINKLQRHLLRIVDPEIRSMMYQMFLVVINLVITLLTLGKANEIKASRTGNCLFFNQTALGEQVRFMGQQIVEVMDEPICEKKSM